MKFKTLAMLAISMLSFYSLAFAGADNNRNWNRVVADDSASQLTQQPPMSGESPSTSSPTDNNIGSPAPEAPNPETPNADTPNADTQLPAPSDDMANNPDTGTGDDDY